jgi:hypothetical protein
MRPRRQRSLLHFNSLRRLRKRSTQRILAQGTGNALDSQGNVSCKFVHFQLLLLITYTLLQIT